MDGNVYRLAVCPHCFAGVNAVQITRAAARVAMPSRSLLAAQVVRLL